MNKTKNNQYTIIAIILLIFLITYIIISQTSAKYISESSGLDSARVAAFAVNVSSLTSSGEVKPFESDLEFAINDKGIVKQGKIAPGFTATSSFIIDTTGTEVGTTYNIHFGKVTCFGKTLENVNFNKVIATYTDSNGDEITTNLELIKVEDRTECSGNIDLENINCPITITATILWDYIENDENEFGIEQGNLIAPVSVTVKQKD